MGIFVGIIASAIVGYACLLLDMLIEFFSDNFNDYVYPERHIHTFFYRFYAAFAVACGFCFTIWIWMKPSGGASQKKKSHLRRSQTYAAVIVWACVLCTLKCFLMIFYSVHSKMLTARYLNLHEDLFWLFLLLPLVIYLQAWLGVRRAYKSVKWMLISFLACIAAAFILSSFINDDERFERQMSAYNYEYQFSNEHVDQELRRADSLYGITFDDQTIQLLKLRRSKPARKQVRAVQKAFGNREGVSLDTVILEKIMIHNVKSHQVEYNYSFPLWDYAYPGSLVYHIRKNDPNAPITKELVSLLREEILLSNGPDSIRYGYSNDWRRESFAKHYIRPQLVKFLRMARDTILLDSTYEMYHHLLPPVKPIIKNPERFD